MMRSIVLHRLHLWTAAVLLVAGTVVARAQATATLDGVVYTLIDDHYEASSLDPSLTADAAALLSLRVADAIGGVPVTSVAAHAFDGNVNALCRSIRQVTVGASVTTIGEYAFYYCTDLTAITLPESLTAIGRNAFFSCTALTGVDLPDGLTTIGNFAFNGCTALTRLTMTGDGLTIGVSAFAACTALVEIVIRGGVPSVGSTAFYDVGSTAVPARVVIDGDRLSDFLAAMTVVGSSLRWNDGHGTLMLQTITGGLRYTYHPAQDGEQPAFELSAIDDATLPVQDFDGITVYHLCPEAAISGTSVTGIAKGAFSSALGDRIYLADLRRLPVTAISGADYAERLEGMSPATMAYLADGTVTTSLNAVTAPLSTDEIASGRVAWLLNSYWGAPLFGQQIGLEPEPLPLTDAARQQVWQVTFAHGDQQAYRYANTGATVSLAGPAEVGFAADAAVSYYTAEGNTFGTSTAVTGDITVSVLPRVAGITLSHDHFSCSATASESERMLQLTATCQPAEAMAAVTWSSANTAVATVTADGRVLAVEGGEAVITATSTDNPAVSATCVVSVTPGPKGISIIPGNVTLQLSGDSAAVQLQAVITPAEAPQAVEWSCADERVAKVAPDGLLTAVGRGKTVVYAMPAGNMSVVAVCYVTVGTDWTPGTTPDASGDDSQDDSNDGSQDYSNDDSQDGDTEQPTEPTPPAQEPPLTIAISPASANLHLTNGPLTLQLSATVSPAGDGWQMVWSSADERVATVSSGGLLTAVGRGSTVVYAQVAGNTTVVAVCYVTVEATVAPLAPDVPDTPATPDTPDSSDGTDATDGSDIPDAPADPVPDTTPRYLPGEFYTVDGISYMVTAFENDGIATATVSSVGSDLLGSGQTVAIPSQVRIGNDLFTVTAAAANAFDTPTGNTLILLPAAIDYRGGADNIVREAADGTKSCRRLVITDGADFNTDLAIHVETLVYERPLQARPEPYTICLPYSVNASAGRLRWFEFSDAEGATLVFSEVTGTTVPYQPYLVVASADVSDLGGTDILVSTRGSNADIYHGDFGLVGAMRRLTSDEALRMHACVLNGSGTAWQAVDGGGTIAVTALRSYLWTTGTQPTDMRLVTLSQEPTAIQGIAGPDAAPASYYDLRGRYVGTALNAAPKGIYIRRTADGQTRKIRK